MPCTLRILLSFFLLSFLSVFGQSPQYENKIVENICIVLNSTNAENFDVEGLKKRLKTKEGDHFSQSEFDHDLKNLIQDFDRIVPEITCKGNKIYIELKIALKPKIGMIYWTGNEKIKTKTLEKELAVLKGSTFDRQTFNKAFRKLKTHYIKEGFFEAEINYEVTSNDLCNEVNIEISIIEGRAGRIKKVVFCGLDPCEQDEVLDIMVTKSYNFFTSWITGEGTYNEDAIQQDQFVILNYLQNKGYADAKVGISLLDAEEPNRIIVSVNADKGPIYSIGQVSFEGNKLFCDADIQKKITAHVGCPYGPDTIRKTIENITALYGKFGYIDAYVDYEPKLIDGKFAYSIHFRIHEGKEYRVGMIKVLGNCSTQTNIILHEVILTPGEVFNSEKLQATESRLKNVGFFKNVNVYAVKSDKSSCFGDNYRDIHVEVEETSTGHFGGSIGISTAERFFGGLNVTENNFNHRGFSRFFSDGYQALRGGGEYAHITATVGQKSRSYVLSWTKPYFMDTEWSIGFDLENSSTRYISNDYDINANGLTLHATNQINSFVRLGYHYRIRNSDVHVSKKKSVTKEEEKQLHHDGLISAAGLSLLYDSTDHPLRPTTGFKSRLESELVGLGGRYHFFSIAYLNSYYIPIDKESVLKFRADARFINPMFNTAEYEIPIDERLFLGGDSMLRGYKPYKVGPLFKGSKDPKGGTSLQFLSLEYTRRLFRRLDGFLFCDSGHLADRNWTFGRMYTSAGYGIKFQVFEDGPPIQLGIGYPINPKNRKKQTKNFFFMVGGKF